MEVRCSALCLIWKINFFWSKFQFYADLHQLSKAHSQAASLLKHTQMDPLLRNNIKQILEATRPLSFCQFQVSNDNQLKLIDHWIECGHPYRNQLLLTMMLWPVYKACKGLWRSSSHLLLNYLPTLETLEILFISKRVDFMVLFDISVPTTTFTFHFTNFYATLEKSTICSTSECL